MLFRQGGEYIGNGSRTVYKLMVMGDAANLLI